MEYVLPVLIAVVATVSIIITPKADNGGTFFQGLSPAGGVPGLLTLTFSQVTTWIFARSLMNAAILGFYYGLWGTLAYAFYYLSFLTGGLIIDDLRFRKGYTSIQGFLYDRFGDWGTRCYNLVIGIRLSSEVFANLLVIGILFGAAGSGSYALAVIGLAAVTLLYSMLGGLHASLRTDLFQMLIFILILGILITLVMGGGHLTLQNILFIPFQFDQPGPVLMLVALLQIWSYPMHDPVMMDRGFLADRQTTRRSFLHAAWISIICILLFGSLGVLAGAQAASGCRRVHPAMGTSNAGMGVASGYAMPPPVGHCYRERQTGCRIAPDRAAAEPAAGVYVVGWRRLRHHHYRNRVKGTPSGRSKALRSHQGSAIAPDAENHGSQSVDGSLQR